MTLKDEYLCQHGPEGGVQNQLPKGFNGHGPILTQAEHETCDTPTTLPQSRSMVTSVTSIYGGEPARRLFQWDHSQSHVSARHDSHHGIWMVFTLMGWASCPVHQCKDLADFALHTGTFLEFVLQLSSLFTPGFPTQILYMYMCICIYTHLYSVSICINKIFLDVVSGFRV